MDAPWPRMASRMLALTRFAMAWVFLWPFLDKTFGLGFATPREAAWIRGGDPTAGFLRFGTSGPFKDAFVAMADSVFVEWLFMIGLLGIGLALALGIGMRIAVVSGSLLLILMWAAILPLEHNPFLDDHLVYAIVLVLLLAFDAGRPMGLAEKWSGLGFVQKAPWLK